MTKCATEGCNALVAKHTHCARCRPRPRYVDRRPTHKSPVAKEAERRRALLAGLPPGFEAA